jgi:membrane protein implicated in regulation of membrane protease activity
VNLAHALLYETVMGCILPLVIGHRLSLSYWVGKLIWASLMSISWWWSGRGFKRSAILLTMMLRPTLSQRHITHNSDIAVGKSLM